LIIRMGKQHGTLAKAGKVRKQTPKVAKVEKRRKTLGRALKRKQYQKRYANAVLAPGQKAKSPNWNAGRPAEVVGK
jgi:small subunit ribosomal protein S30e